MPGGRPSKYKPEFCDTVLAMLKEGMCKYEIALELDIDVHTLDNWANAHEEFLTALKKGDGFAQGWWRRHGRLNIHNKDFNSGLWFMNMKNRWGWSDKQSVEQNTNISMSEATKRKVREVLDEQ